MPVVNPTIIMAAGKGSRMKARADLPPEVLLEASARPKAMIRIGKARKPLLAYILQQLASEGCTGACVVIAEDDTITPAHFNRHPIDRLEVSFVRQAIPAGRTKPLGTAHAVQLALEAHPAWAAHSVTVGNGDNLAPRGMFRALFAHPAALPAFHPNHLGLPKKRIRAFAVIHTDEVGRFEAITEKPSVAEMAEAQLTDGQVRVSMNYFRMPCEQLLQAVKTVPEHPVRKERELPVAISRWARMEGGKMKALPMAGSFLDLTHPEDIVKAGEIIDSGGFALKERT